LELHWCPGSKNTREKTTVSFAAQIDEGKKKQARQAGEIPMAKGIQGFVFLKVFRANRSPNLMARKRPLFLEKRTLPWAGGM